MTTARPRKSTRPLGSVSLVCAGPGDPELLTVRAIALLANADAVVADADVTGIAARYAPEAELVPVVNEDGLPLERPARAKKVVEHARTGQTVVRLYSGDPILDGAIAAEANTLHRSKIPFEIAPGVSVTTGVAAYGGFPLLAGKAKELRIVDADSVEDWAELASPRLTVVVRDGADKAVEISKALLAAGRKADTPIAITRGATTVEQRTIASTLEELPAAVKAAKQAGPGTVVIGEVINSRDKLSWFETKPLFGWRVLVPRTKEQAASLSEQLRRYGAVPVEVPTISVEPPRTPQQMERAIQGLVSGRYQWIAFTSANAVKAVREKFEDYGLDARAMAGLKIAAVGEQTAAALIAFGVKPDLVPTDDQSSAGLVAQWPPYDAEIDPIDRVFLPRADIATETLAAGLQSLGWEVDDVTAYRTVRAAPPPAETREAIKTGGFDAVMFTSSSTVRNLVGIAGKPHACTVVACIGPQTAEAAGEHGLRVDVLADTPNVMVLAENLAAHAEELRQKAIENGDLTWRPSRRRAGSRRKAT
ncbi:MAG: bifunctional uroporphyrinogen-III C-methyltransferase/uroporphyrinogen-III synthase [Candidatus Nanopelagicales bacterium]